MRIHTTAQLPAAKAALSLILVLNAGSLALAQTEVAAMVGAGERPGELWSAAR